MDLSAVISEWMAFAGVMALGQFSPGPDMLLLTRTALAKGWKAGCATALGIALGLGIHSAIALFGVAALLMQGGDRVDRPDFCGRIVFALARMAAFPGSLVEPRFAYGESRVQV